MHISHKKRKEIYKTRSIIAQLLLSGADFIAFNLGIFCAALIITLLYKNLNNYIPANEQLSRLEAHLILSILCVSWFWFRLRHYTYRKPFWFELKEILRTILIFAVIDLGITAFSKWQMSRNAWVLTWVSVLILVPLFRFGTKELLKHLKLWKKQCIIIGIGNNAQDAYRALTSEKSLGFDIQYFFSPTPKEAQRELLGLRIIDNERLLWRTTDRRNSQYIIALDDDQGKLREYWIKRLAVNKCRSVSVIPTTRGLPLNSTDMSFIFRYEVLLLRINNNLTKKSARLIKRVFDIACSLFIILLLSPVLAYLAIWVMKDGGSPIYGHTRVGLSGRAFKCLKFRSMVKNSQEVLDHLLSTDSDAKAEWEKDFKLRNDPRITKVGHFLRKSSLDELPQLFNVLRGEMSLVGPRPITQEELDRYGDNKDYYLMAKPGITGLWQVSGRNDVDYETRVYFDAWYVKNWSLWNDIAILFKTIDVVLKKDGAY